MGRDPDSRPSAAPDVLTAFVLLAMLPLPPALLACGVAATVAPAAARVATLVLTWCGTLLVASFVIGGSVPGTMKLPVGLPLVGVNLGLDALSGVFLLPMLLAATA